VAARQAAVPILSARDLSVDFKLEHGVMRAVDGVGFDVRRGEVLGIVGESGSGKSQILMAAMGLTAINGRCSGSVTFEGQEILNALPEKLDHIRGSSMSMIFQDPMTSLNPYMRVVDQLTESGRAPGQEQGRSGRHRRSRCWSGCAFDAPAHLALSAVLQRRTPARHDRHGAAVQAGLLFADEPTTAPTWAAGADSDLLNGLVRQLNAAVVIVTMTSTSLRMRP
jgi:ABC-type dipeptide/oligopeptide/nickel transport system ATPase component